MVGSTPILSVTDTVAVLNQTLQSVYPTLYIAGEVSSYKISKQKWVHFDIKDDGAKLRCFTTVFQLPMPLEDGMRVELVAEPKLHPQFGFSLTVRTVKPVGEGSIKKAALLLRAKLETEGLFAGERKRFVPRPPDRVGLIASEQSAAYADFIKIMNARWGGVDIQLYDVQVQGESAPETIIDAITHFNQTSDPVDVLVLIRGGGSADDLVAFSEEKVVRAVAGSRIPTMVAIGHETDESLAELAADLRASTPSNAAELLFLDKREVARQLKSQHTQLASQTLQVLQNYHQRTAEYRRQLSELPLRVIEQKQQDIRQAKSLLESMHPKASLRRGYALVERDGYLVHSASQLKVDDKVKLTLQDGNAEGQIKKVY